MREPWEAGLELAEKKIRFVHRGRTLSGLDCAGVLVWIATENLLEVHDRTDPKTGQVVYSKDPSDGELRRVIELNLGQEVDRDPGDLRVNDVLLMQLPGQAEPGHIAIVAPYPAQGHLSMIHAYGSVGQVVHHRLDFKWIRRIRGVWEWPAKD